MTDAGSEGRIAAYRAARTAVLARIAAACQRADRAPSGVRLLAVSKTVDAEPLRDAVAAGLDLLGENRVQEAAAKAPLVPGARWQMVGPLQANKVRRALAVFELIQSVDSVGLAVRIDRLVREVRPGPRYPVLLQVNVDGDPAKVGFDPTELPAAVTELARLDALEVRGLMTIGRLVNDPAQARPTFRRLRALSVELRDAGLPIGSELSMGMTDDFEVAVEEGATIVRIGRALFGERPTHDHGHTHG
jgi:PLP dependent protein